MVSTLDLVWSDWVDNTGTYVNKPHTQYILAEATDGEDVCWPTYEKKRITIIHITGPILIAVFITEMVILFKHIIIIIIIIIICLVWVLCMWLFYTLTLINYHLWVNHKLTVDQLIEKPGFEYWTWLLLFRDVYKLLKIKPLLQCIVCSSHTRLFNAVKGNFK